VANRARPYAISLPIGAKPKVWEAHMITRRNGVTYIWYRAVPSQGSMILPSHKRPPSGWNGKGAELHPHLAEWLGAFAEGDNSPTLEARKRAQMLADLADAAKKLL